MKNFKRIIIALIVACVVIASYPVSGSVVDAKTISIKNGNAIEEITINKKSGKVTTKDTSHKADWYKKSGVQYYFGKNKKIASYKWQNKTLYKWQNGSFKKYTGTKRLSNDKSYYFNKGKKANGIVKKSGKYYYYKGGKQTVYSKSCDKWKTGKTQYYFGKGNKSATYVYYSDKKILKKWNKTKKSYQKYTGVFTLSDGKTYRFSIGKRGTIKSSVTAGTDKTTAVYKNAKGNPENVTGWKQVKNVRYYFNKAATASFKIEKDVCYVFVAGIDEQSTDNLDINGTWKKYSGVFDNEYYAKGKVKPAEKDTITTDQSGLRVKWDGKNWKKFTGTYKKLYYVNGDYASGIVDGKYYRSGKLATGICENKYYKDGVLGTGSYNGKRYSEGSLLTGTCNGKFYKNGELYTGIRKSNGKYYVDGVLANGTYDGVKYVDGVAQSDDSGDKDEEKLTEGEFRTNSGKLQKCVAELYSGSLDGDYFERDGKYYTLAWRDYTGEYESKFYEAGKHVDYKLYGADGKLYTGWCRLYNPSNWEYAKWIHAINEKQYPNLLYVENGVVKQYYVYEGDETHIWCNTCGSDLTIEGVKISKHREDCHVGTIIGDTDDDTNGTTAYKYTNNGKTYWVTNPHNNFYRWDTTKSQYVEHFRTNSDQTGRECVDSDASSEFYGSFIGLSIVYSASDWKVGQSSIVLVNKDIVLK